MGVAPNVLWSPTAERVQRAAITRIARWVQDTRSVRVTESYDQLWRWSVDDLEGFWAAVWEYFGVQADGGYERVLADAAMPGAQWFAGTRLKYAEHVFRDRDPSAAALQFASEQHDLQAWTWGHLRDETARI